MPWLFSPILRPWLLTAALASLLLNLALLVPSIYLLQVFDRVFSSRSLETLAMLTLLAALALGLAGAMDRVRALLLARAGERLEAALAAPALRAQLISAARAGRGDDGSLMPDVARLRHFLASPGMQAAFDAPWLPVYLALIALLHPLLGLAAALAGALLFGLGRLGERLLRADEAALADARRRSARQLDACLRHAEVLAGMRMTEAAIERWQRGQEPLQALQQRMDDRAAALAAAGRVLRQAVQVAMLALGAWLVLSAQARPGIMIAATLLVGRALAPVEQLVAGWRAVLAARDAWRRVSSQAVPPAGGSIALPAARGALSLEQVSVLADDGRTLLLKSVDLTVPAGTVLGVVGASGAGKTTLVRTLLGLRLPARGQVRLDGVALADWPEAQLRDALGYLPQDVALFAGSVAENIARLGPVDDAAVVAAAQAAGVHELIARLPRGYDTPLGDDTTRLSGGQRQRLGLARALYGRPALVVLDEPNAHLDADGDAALARAVDLLKTRGTTVVLVSHRPALLRVVDRLLVLRDGAVAHCGPRDAVLSALQPPPARRSDLGPDRHDVSSGAAVVPAPRGAIEAARAPATEEVCA